jgi:endo-1,4-beta-xylanase
MTKTMAVALACCAAALGQPLRDLGARRGVRMGTAVDPSYFTTESTYAATLAREYDQAEPENDMKFGPIHPGPATYSFTRADAIVKFSGDRAMAVRGHTLVWYQQNPAWLTGLSPKDLSDALADHIHTVVGRYAGKVYAWDVVNEAFNDDGTLRSTIWSNAPGIGLTGTAYIEQAFRWAHEADPQGKLFYNDYNAEGVNTKSDAIYRMAQDFVARGVPLRGIGLQMHLTAGGFSKTSVDANLKRLTDLGLEVQITELDVRLPVDSTGTASAANLTTQAQIYHDVVELCLKYPKCTAVQTWGFTDRHSWIPGTFPGMGAGLPFDSSYQSKPAYDAMASVLQTAPPVIAAGGLANAASYATGAVAPGEIAVLFGASYGPADLAMGSSLSDVRLLFDGEPAQLLYAQVGQAGAVVPLSVAGKTSTSVQYEYRGVTSNTIVLPVKPVLPGLFTLDSSGAGAGAFLASADGSSFHVVSKTNPAYRGDYLALYGTGGGVSVTAADATVTIGGVDCPVSYAGPAPGLVAGALQVNVRVAANVPAGEQLVVLQIGGAASQAGVTTTIE